MMKLLSMTAFLVSALAACPASAQDHSAHGPAAAAGGLPAICGTSAAATTTASPMDHGMDAAHAALMTGMDEMHAQMMAGMEAKDIDVAFVCGMIPHHRGAIAMAQAELEHGDDPWAKELARKVVEAQEEEVAEMLAWLEQQASR